jgi:hypothetical protein
VPGLGERSPAIEPYFSLASQEKITRPHKRQTHLVSNSSADPGTINHPPVRPDRADPAEIRTIRAGFFMAEFFLTKV